MNLRHGTAMKFGDEASQLAHEQAVETARQLMTTRYAIAPGNSLKTARGVLAEAEPIEPSDLSDVLVADGTIVPGWRAFELLLSKGIIMERVG